MACALIKISSAACAVIGKFPVSNRQPNDPKGSCLTFARQPMYWALSRRRSIAGEQLTPGAPRRIHITDAVRSRFVEHSPTGYIIMQDATRLLGVSRQSV